MNRLLLCCIAVLIPASVSANDATQQIEEIVVTGAVRSSEAIEIAAIDLPGDAELKNLPIISE